ncbi:helicase loader [Streptococcus phage CHPC950]|uniref:Helicase loader n=1 Tax=Streptococcus phage CHPC950 TaxID=2365054 RepID=A0A3G8FB64_9CAUD|nr:helicase loader [Streptococcus phage CHPC950]AZF91072.1 helicase loader [Streptococcus phage CHPC950]AZF91259.1 helicase loader [Streptococcus phage CHPC1014]AZF92808.1 helicase loader [Streptococcus phage CHPC982]
MNLEQTAKQLRKQYMTVSNKYCDKHQRHFVTIQLPNSKPYTVCEMCHREEQEKQNSIKAQEQYEREQEQKRLYFLKDFSLLDDDLKNASFDNYKAVTREQKEDLKNVRSQLKGYLGGQDYNIVLIGDTGVGKSHLAYSALKALSDHTKKMGIFINVVDLLAKIKEDFRLEAEYIRRISEAEWLVLDDLGTEKVTEWSNGILYSILNKRTKTIITTNLNPQDIMGTYGKRVYSRIFKKTGLGTTNEHVYQFKTQQDKRMML